MSGGTSRRSVVFVNRHYWPDVAATGQCLTDLAEFLAKVGWDVTVVTAKGGYRGDHHPGWTLGVHNGVRLLRVPCTSFGRSSTLGRLVDYATFGVASSLRLLVSSARGVVVALTTPPLLPLGVGLVTALRRGRFVIWSMDLHPEAEEAVGMFRRGGIVSRVTRRAMDIAYRLADRVIALGPYMKARLGAYPGLDPDDVEVIPVWSRAEELERVPDGDNPLLHDPGSGRTVVMYSGNAGFAHRFDEYLAAVERLAGDTGYRFLFVGGGPRRAEIERHLSAADVPYEYGSYVPREQLAASLSLADVHIITLRSDMVGIAVPVKVFGAMAVEKPLLMIGPRGSETAELIEGAGCGWVVDPDLDPDPIERIVSLLRSVRENPEEAGRRGRLGRSMLEEECGADHVMPRWNHLLESLGAATE